MAEPTPSSEAVVRAVASKEIVTPLAGGVLSPEKARANTIREQLATEGTKKTLEGFVDRTPKKGEIKALVDDNHGTDIDPKTGEKVRTVAAKIEYDQTRKKVDQLFTYLETGKLDPDPVVVSEVKANIAEIFRMYPGGEDILNELGAGVITDNVLNDPEFRTKIQERLTEIKAQRVAEIDPGAESTFKEANRAVKEKERERDRIKGQVDTVSAGLNLYERKSGVDDGALIKELDTLTSGLASLQVNADNAGLAMRPLDSRIKALNRKYDLIADGKIPLSGGKTMEVMLDAVQSDIEKAEAEKDSKQVEIDSYEKAKIRITQLKEDKAGLETRKKEIMPEKDKVDGELDALVEARIEAETALARAKKIRSQQERDFLLSLEDIYKDSAVKYYDDQVKAAEEAQQVLLDKEIGEAKDELEKGMLDIFGGKRWDEFKDKKGIIRPTRKTVSIRKDIVNADFANLIMHGPEGSARGILQAAGFTAEQITEKMKDPEFSKKAQDMLVEQLIVRKIKTGKITEDEAFIIGTSPWGAEVINKALAKNSAAKGTADQLRSAGALNPEGIRDWIRKNPDKSAAASLLAVLFGIPLALIGAGVIGLGAVGAGAAGGIATINSQR